MTEKKEGIRLSYSAIDVYNSCSEKYRLERILKLTPTSISTALCFGSAIDQASDVIFKAKMKSKETGNFEVKFNRDEMVERFKQALTVVDYQGDKLDITQSPKVKYSKADVQAELLEKSDREAINKFLIERELEIDSIEEYIEYFKDKKEHTEEETVIYNYIAWHCLFRKGVIMLDVLIKWADEKIIEVISVQNYFKIENEHSDVFSGLSDLQAIMIDSPDEITTVDLKTATRAKAQYPVGCVETSPQLTIYSAVNGDDRVGYAAIEKNIKKREPRTEVHEVYGRITEEQRDSVFNLIDETLQNIKLGKFEKNKDACYRYGRCVFSDLCWKGDRTGLVDRVYSPKKSVDPIEKTE